MDFWISSSTVFVGRSVVIAEITKLIFAVCRQWFALWAKTHKEHLAGVFVGRSIQLKSPGDRITISSINLSLITTQLRLSS